MEVQQVEVGKLKPWDNNPRINDHAVDAVAEHQAVWLQFAHPVR